MEIIAERRLSIPAICRMKLHLLCNSDGLGISLAEISSRVALEPVEKIETELVEMLLL